MSNDREISDTESEPREARTDIIVTLLVATVIELICFRFFVKHGKRMSRTQG